MSVQNDESPRWYYSKTPKAVVLTCHGVNALPSGLGPLAEFLQKSSFDVYRGALSDHTGDYPKFKNCSFKQWAKDFNLLKTEALKRATELNLPLYFLGHSLGSALALESSKNGKGFDKLFLIAPAIRPRWYTKVLNIFRLFGPHFPLPSANIPQYRAYPKTPVSAYLSLKELRRSLDKVSSSDLNRATTIYMHPKDELVDYKKVKKFIGQRNLNNWQLLPPPQKKPTYFYHLIIDQESLGIDDWRFLTKAVLESFQDEKIS
jgi:alpha-beta hydrolase superfamily lysophospholipase